jgi:PmbA protein
LDSHPLNEIALSEAKKLNVDDAISLSTDYREQMIRFANDSITVAKKLRENSLFVYLSRDKKRALAVSTNPDEKSVRKFVRDLFDSMKTLPPDPNFNELPRRSYRFSNKPGSYDNRLEDVGKDLPDLARQAIEESRKAGAQRSAGAIVAAVSKTSIMATTGTEGSDKGSEITLNVRSFADHNASGHALSCSANLSNFGPKEAGRRAGEDAKRMANAKPCDPGQYDVIMSPTVASNLFSLVGAFASAFAVDAGISFLEGKMKKAVGSESFTLTDHGTIKGGLGSRSFDDEGLPTQETRIVDKGILEHYLHNLSTAKKFKTTSTGNAGIIEPHPWNLEVSAGDSNLDEMIRTTKKGILLTSNWYTRFKNYRSGEFSTVPRDGTYLVHNGELGTPLTCLRISDSLERLLKSVGLVSSDREWIKWWEVEVPTLCPWVMASGVSVTRAFGQ